MKFGITHLSCIPVRAQPSDTSEMITQLLFGETFTILSAEKQWRKIRCTLDNYEGWIDEKQFLHIAEKIIVEAKLKSSFSLEIAQSVTNHNHHIPILLGSTLPFYDGINFKLADTKYWFNGQAYAPDSDSDPLALIEKVALKYQFAPYLWGGRSPFGIDCSGLIQVVFKILGNPLPRDAYQQAEQGTEISFSNEAKAGDLAFFPNKEGKIAHVGIILNENRIIHAYGHVRIDKFDHFGIFNEEQKKYTHKLRFIKRIL